MATVQSQLTAMNNWFVRQIRDIHTNIRARVLEVDYSIPSATVQPITSTVYDQEYVDSYPPIFDVPLSMHSGNGGKSRLAIPLKPGDVVGLTFSERNENDSADLTTHGLNPGWAVTTIHADGNPQPIDPDNVELWNDQVHFSMTPSGDYTLTGPVGEMKVDQTGNFSFTNGTGTLTIDPSGVMTYTNGAANFAAMPSGQIMMNGAQVTPDGNFITAQGVNMNEFFEYFTRHLHHYTWTDGSGESDTTSPLP